MRRHVLTGILLGSFFCGYAQANNIYPERRKKAPPPVSTRTVVLSKSANLRQLKDGVLEVIVAVPSGARVQVVNGVAPEFHPYRLASGELGRSTNGFYPSIRLVSVPGSARARRKRESFPPEVIDRINQTPGGVYLSSVDINTANDLNGMIPPLPLSGEPDSTYLKYFYPSGKRVKNNFSERLRRRFGDNFNREIPMTSLPEYEQRKWSAIYRQLVEIADRTKLTKASHLFIDAGDTNRNVALARKYSEEFETTGTIQRFGSWSIAVLGTAPRHGFANVPCAEFASEIIRQAYTKAGYKMNDDFKDKNYLLWSNTAAVVNLARALNDSGWIPWDAAEFKPKTGAVAMHAIANSPGHTFMIAGENGRFVVDNGSPRGRDLYKSNATKDIVGLMYDTGVFFLPPGIIPERWDESDSR